MSICENPDPSTVLAGPPQKVFRKVDSYDMCLANKSTKANENKNYEETPIPIFELPDASENTFYSGIPMRGIYVIPYDRPQTILVADPNASYKNSKTVKYCKKQKNGRNLSEYQRTVSLNMIYHTYLTGALPVIAAGEYRLMANKNIKIDNKSGHYIPSNNTLLYAQCLFEKKGYTVTATQHTTKENKNVLFFQESRPLSYWMTTPKEEWYSVAKASQGGKQTKNQKRSKKRSNQKTRRLRGKNI